MDEAERAEEEDAMLSRLLCPPPSEMEMLDVSWRSVRADIRARNLRVVTKNMKSFSEVNVVLFDSQYEYEIITSTLLKCRNR